MTGTTDGPASGPAHGRPVPRRQGPDTGSVTVFVADEQEGHPVDAARWSTLAEQVVVAQGIQGEAELAVIFVDEAHIADLNARFMGHDGPTDVLSFPIDAVVDGSWVEATAEAEITFSGTGPIGRAGYDPDDQPILLGDVVICPAVAARQAAEHAGTYEDEIALLLVHGILHVFGHDHADDEQRVAMQARERELLDAFHGALARDPWTS
jgi:probable rRNA maturation factor